MIRPLTIATCLLACGSGLYLYQSKHEVQLLDRTIERTVHDTNALREQSRLLAAEWTMLNDPERLRQFSDTYLSLKTISPTQFTSVADLDTRLPAKQAETPPSGTDDASPAPVVSEAAPPANAESTDDPAAPAATTEPAAVAEEDLPVPPIPAIVPAPAAPRPAAVVATARPAEIRQPERVALARSPMVESSQSRPVPVPVPVAEARPVDTRAFDQRAAPRLVDARTDIRTVATPPAPRPIVLAAPRPYPASTPVAMAPQPASARPPVMPASAPYAGSLLGMARGSMPPAPRPTPVNATYNSN